MSTPPQSIDALRAAIDKVDHHIVQLLSERYKLVCTIQALKRQSGLPPRDPKRETDMLVRRGQWSEEAELPPAMVIEIFQRILAHLPPNPDD
ncbi:MAG: hypothetical protein D6694_09780 [Gammaproteobacteria bacterium]|nr:MAG: hypothetical protein D6694_09780 [Gammaproteobacteria bacterium]